MTEYTTRNLTADETTSFMRGLNLALGGKTGLVDAVLRVVADQGLGVFAATKVQDYADSPQTFRDLAARTGTTTCRRCALTVAGPDTFGDYTDTDGQLRCTRVDGEPHAV